MKIQFAFAAILVIFSSYSLAQSDSGPKKYAAMSLVGDSLGVVTDLEESGNHLDTNGFQEMPINSAVVDQPTLFAIDDAVHKLNAGSSTALLATSSAALHKLQSQLISGGHLANNTEVGDALKKSGASYFFLVTKFRSETNMHAGQEDLGHGSLYGVGFYIDRHTHMRSEDTGNRTVGYLAPYLYIKVYLIDVATSSVLGEREITDSRVISAAKDNSSSDAWDILTPQQKASELNKMLSNDVMSAVTDLLKPKS